MPDDGGGASRSTDPASGSSSATDVSLRELLSMQIGYERGTTRLLVGFAGVAGAFAWSQIQRRLEILNHANARVATIAEKTVSSDTYLSDETRRSAERAKLDEWRKEVDTDRSRSISRDEFQKDTREINRDERTDKRGSYSLALQVLAGGIGLILFFLVIFATYKAIKPNIPQPTTTTVITTTPPPIVVPSTTVTVPPPTSTTP